MAKRGYSIQIWFVIVAVVAAASARGQIPSTARSSAGAAGRPQEKRRGDFAEMIRYEPTGLSLLRPYERGKVPVVFIHGLWSNPCSWSHMIESLEADPALRDRYQFWTFGYSTGDPLPYSALLLRSNLEEVRRKFDPEGSDRAFDQMVVVGHSMGGLLTKMMVQETGRPLVAGRQRSAGGRTRGRSGGSRAVPPRTFLQAAAGGPPRGIHRHAPSRQPGRSGAAGAPRLAAHSPARPAPGVAQPAHRPQQPDFFNERFRKGLPTSVDELEWQSPILMRLDQLGLAPAIKAHSIIAVQHDPPRASGGDGMVPYDSAHLDGVASELLVSSGHLCQDKPAVIREVRRHPPRASGSLKAPSRSDRVDFYPRNETGPRSVHRAGGMNVYCFAGGTAGLSLIARDVAVLFMNLVANGDFVDVERP